MSAPQKVQALVAQYESERVATQSDPQLDLRRQQKYVRKLFGALAWHASPASGRTSQGGRVFPEHTLKSIVSSERTPPEYSLRIDGDRKCFVGVTPASVEPREGPSPAVHLRRFAWSANLPAALVGNFEQLSLYSGRIRPRVEDRPDVARLLSVRYTEYEKRWDELAAILSPEAVEQGALDKITEQPDNVTGSLPVDDAFLDEIEAWRLRLARDIDRRHPSLSLEELNTVVQTTIDRIIFLRICEDRGIEPYGQLKALQNDTNAYRRLLELFLRADARYNAGLFRFRSAGAAAGVEDIISRLSIGDEVLRSIFRALYYPESPYEFSVISVDILGQVYERFLGRVIDRSPEQGIAVVNKPELRKSEGVYYTPARVVNALVRGTVGKLFEGKTPEEVIHLRILDPACGSGSFLNAAYQHLLDWYRDRYAADSDRYQDRIRRVTGAGPQLTLEERKRILLDHIYGVDLDAQAVEVTKLSLLLKVLEGEEGRGVNRRQLVLMRERALPSLDQNLQCGNTLIDKDFGKSADGLDEEEQRRLRPFSYEEAFPCVFSSEAPGFDVVLGNPPYLSYSGRQSVKPPTPVREYYRGIYKSYAWPAAHAFFMERSVKHLSRRYVAFIVPDQVGHLQNYGALREVMTEGGGLVEVRYWGEHIFKGVTTPALTFIIDKTFDGATRIIEEDGSQRVGTLSGTVPWNISRFQILLDKVHERSFSLGDRIKDCGIRTWDAESQVIPIASSSATDIPVLEGEVVDRYVCHPPVSAVRMEIRGSPAKYQEAVFVIRQTAPYPIVGPREHATYFRNTLMALYDRGQWPDVRYIVGLLNSRLMRFVYREEVREAKQRTFPQVKARSLRALPLRSLDFGKAEERAWHEEIVRNVEEILNLHRALSTATDVERNLIEKRIHLLDDRIDRLVYHLYGLSREEITLIERSLAIKSPSAASTNQDLEARTSEELWATVDRNVRDEMWRASLTELVEREDPGVASYVANELHCPDLAPEARAALVLAAERAQCFDPTTRAALKAGLLAHAVALRDATEGRPLWAAIRRFASLVPIDESDELLSFLRDEDAHATKQAALQAIQSIFTTEVAPESRAVIRLRERVHSLAATLLTPACVTQPANASLALQAFCAAASLADPKLPALAALFVEIQRPYLIGRALDVLQRLQGTWSRSGKEASVPDFRRILSESAACLVVSPAVAGGSS